MLGQDRQPLTSPTHYFHNHMNNPDIQHLTREEYETLRMDLRADGLVKLRRELEGLPVRDEGNLEEVNSLIDDLRGAKTSLLLFMQQQEHPRPRTMRQY